MRKLNGAAGICAAAVIFSCAGITPVTALDEKMSCRGLSFLPPQEEGWLVVARSQDGIALARKGDDPDETYSAHVAIVKMPFDAPPILFVTTDLVQRYADDRFKQIQSESIKTNMIKGCEKYLSTRWDYKARKDSGNPDPMIIKDYDQYCVHPHKEGYLSLVTFSHRYYPGDEDPAFELKATGFIQSVTLEKF